MDSKQRQLVNKYIDLFFRRKVILISLLLLSLPVGLGVYLSSPKIYQSTCLLSYQKQKISPNRLSPDMKGQVRDIVNTLSQIVTSRTNLEEIIENLDLYPKEREKMPTEDVIQILRKNIRITSSRRGNTFTISYSDPQPDKAARVANAIAAKFVEENLKYRQEMATETSSYTYEELQMAKSVMDAQENAMRDYKLKNYNEMPEQRSINMATLTSLQTQYHETQVSIQDLERTLVLIQDQVNNRIVALKSSAELYSGGEINQSGGKNYSKSEQLARSRLLLDSLLRKYTEKHPETKRVRKEIERLEKEVGIEETSGYSPDKSSHKLLDADKILRQLESQRKNVQHNLTNTKLEKGRLKAKIEQFDVWVSATPVREAEWSSLTREYGQLKRHYDYLVSQDLEAKSMLNLETQQKGSQFRIEDPAQHPGKPIKPDLFRTMGLSLAIGLGSGLGLVLLLDLFDSSFRDPEALQPLLGLPLLITIPYIETEAEKKKVKWKPLLINFLLVLGAILVVVLFVVVWHKGYIVV